MSYDKCLTSFNDATGLNLSEDENKAILQSMLRAKQKIVAQRGLANDEALRQAAGDLADKKLNEAKIKKLNAFRNALVRDNVMAEIESNGGIKNAKDTIRSILHGSNKFFRDNIETTWHSRRDGWIAAIDNQLYKLGVKKIVEKGQMDDEVSRAMWQISNGESSGNTPAGKVAKLYTDALDKARDLLNKVGANIGDAKDYVTRTTYDPTRMRQAAGNSKTVDEAFSAWWGKTEPRLSEKNFIDLVPKPGQSMAVARRELGRSVYDGRITGIDKVINEDIYIPPEYKGTVNVANKVSHHRVLLWKDSDSWLANMKDFGSYPTLHASVMMSLDQAARALSLMDKMGTNPAANLNMILKRVQQTYRGEGDAVNTFKNKMQGIQNVMGRLDGTLNIPANMGFAQGAQALRTWESASSLGGVGVTHLASIFPTVTSELAHHGISRLDSLGNIFKALTTGQGDEARRDILADLGAYADGAIRHTHNAIGDDSVPGKISSMASKLMDLTGIHLVFDRTKAGIRDMLAHNLARNLIKEWDQLDPHLSQMLGKYRITPEEWGAMHDAEMPTWNNRQYLTPSSAEQMVPGMSDKLLSYYTDAAEHGVVTPSVRERALLLGNTRPGTGAGEMLRFLTQFKMWPVAAMHQIMEREIYMSLSAKEAAFNIGMLTAIGVPAGYLRMLINDEATGHPARNPLHAKTLLAAAAQSGGLGIFGDFLFGEANRMGGGIVPTLGGPIVSDADQLVKMFNNAKDGKAGWGDLAHFGVRHIPFANLVYLKGALDYMLWYHLYEAATPGWWERTNRKLQKDQGRTMTGYVPGGGVPYGVPGVHLSTQ